MRWKRQKRTGQYLPKRAQAAVEKGEALIKEAKDSLTISPCRSVTIRSSVLKKLIEVAILMARMTFCQNSPSGRPVVQSFP